MKLYRRNTWSSIWRLVPPNFTHAALVTKGTPEEHDNWLREQQHPIYHTQHPFNSGADMKLVYFANEDMAMLFHLAWN